MSLSVYVIYDVASQLRRERSSGARVVTAVNDEPVCPLWQETCREEGRKGTIYVDWRDVYQ
jgi:hypothetical protein